MFLPRKVASIGISIGAVVSVAAMSFSGPAYADSPSATAAPAGASVAALQQKGEAAIDRQLATITILQGVVNSAKNLTDGHKATLTTLLSDDRAGLTALRAKIAADTDRPTLKSDLTLIVHQYRIYVLAAPKVRLTRAADGVAYSVTKEADAIAKLDAVVAKLKTAGKDTSAIETQPSNAQAQTQAATTAVNGQADALLALQAVDFPGNQGAIGAVRTAVKTGSSDAKNANKDLKAARAAVKTLGGK